MTNTVYQASQLHQEEVRQSLTLTFSKQRRSLNIILRYF